MTIFVATGNVGKLAEFAACAAGAGVEVRALPGLDGMAEPVEDAATFMGNAELKAVAYSLLAPGLLVMADDSGLCVDALSGAPGVRSARFAEDAGFVGEGTKDERNNALLLERLMGVSERGGRFVCALAVAKDGVVVWRSEGSVEGWILLEARGGGGFGYDPLFGLPDGRSMAELGREEKWEVSHRGKAFRTLLREVAA